MAPLFYFNGFNSAIPEDFSDNPKIVAVAQFAARCGYRFVPCSVNYRAADWHLQDVLDRVGSGADHVVFCGSSMGGWFARIVQLRLASLRPGLASKAMAFNPAFDLALHGHLLIGPQVNHVTGEAYQWTAGDSERLASMERSVDYDAPLPFYVYVDKGDELIDWRASAARHEPIGCFTAFEGGSHAFEHYRQALDDLGRVLKDPPGAGV